uniref:Uncharacterized protein n=1 Tax=Cannabis sativa TaxID=3483 RepID=A0A803QNE7_CANSA
MVVEIQGSESTISTRGSFINVMTLFDDEVEEVEQDIELPARGEDDVEEEDVEVGFSDDEDAPLDELFSCEDLAFEGPPVADIWECPLLFPFGCVPIFTQRASSVPFLEKAGRASGYGRTVSLEAKPLNIRWAQAHPKSGLGFLTWKGLGLSLNDNYLYMLHVSRCLETRITVNC